MGRAFFCKFFTSRVAGIAPQCECASARDRRLSDRLRKLFSKFEGRVRAVPRRALEDPDSKHPALLIRSRGDYAGSTEQTMHFDRPRRCLTTASWRESHRMSGSLVAAMPVGNAQRGRNPASLVIGKNVTCRGGGLIAPPSTDPCASRSATGTAR